MRHLTAGLLIGAVAGVIAGFSAGRLTLRPETVEVVRQVVVRDAEDGREGAAERVRRARVEPPAAAARSIAPGPSAPAPPAVPAPAPGAAPPTLVNGIPTDWTVEDFMGQLDAAIRGTPGVNVPLVISELQRRFPGRHVSLELALALIRAGQAFDANWLAPHFTDAELTTVLARAVSAVPEKPASWLLSLAAAPTVAQRRVPVHRSVLDGLLVHDFPVVRRAGLIAAQGNDDAPWDRIREMARGEPEDTVRALAMQLLVERAEDDAARAGLLPLVQAALRDGSNDLRHYTVQLVPALGAGGAPLALDLLLKDGYLANPELADPLVRAVVLAGRADELLAGRPARSTLQMVAEYVPELLEEDPERAAALTPRFAELAAALTVDDGLGYFYEQLAAGGYGAFVAAEARSPRLGADRRLAAFEGFWYSAPDEPPKPRLWSETAQALIWDETATVDLRQSALSALVDDTETRETGFAAQLRIVRDLTTPPALRGHVVNSLLDNFEHEELLRRLPQARAVWREVSEGDPNAWVRGLAAERLLDEWE